METRRCIAVLISPPPLAPALIPCYFEGTWFDIPLRFVGRKASDLNIMRSITYI